MPAKRPRVEPPPGPTTVAIRVVTDAGGAFVMRASSDLPIRALGDVIAANATRFDVDGVALTVESAGAVPLNASVGLWCFGNLLPPDALLGEVLPPRATAVRVVAALATGRRLDACPPVAALPTVEAWPRAIDSSTPTTTTTTDDKARRSPPNEEETSFQARAAHAREGVPAAFALSDASFRALPPPSENLRKRLVQLLEHRTTRGGEDAADVAARQTATLVSAFASDPELLDAIAALAEV